MMAPVFTEALVHTNAHTARVRGRPTTKGRDERTFRTGSFRVLEKESQIYQIDYQKYSDEFTCKSNTNLTEDKTGTNNDKTDYILASQYDGNGNLPDKYPVKKERSSKDSAMLDLQLKDQRDDMTYCFWTLIMMVVIICFSTCIVSWMKSTLLPLYCVIFIVLIGVIAVYKFTSTVDALITKEFDGLSFHVMQSSVLNTKNVVMVSISMNKELRSRRAMFVYYNCRHVVCECHVPRRRDREPSRIPVKRLKR